jgi:FkbM family methyltransferase
MKIFLDGGTHLCEGLIEFHKLGIIDETYKIHTFEANPECNISERIKQLPFKDITAHEVALWTEDGEIPFLQENHKTSLYLSDIHQIGVKKSPSDGYSDIDGWASTAEIDEFLYPGLDNTVYVESIDFDKFVRELPEAEEIVCKLDIEGSEYRIIRKMLQTGTISRIDKLYVEWHPFCPDTHRWMMNEDTNTTEELINQLKDLGIYEGNAPKTYGEWNE